MKQLKVLSTKKLSPEHRTLIPSDWQFIEESFIKINPFDPEVITNSLKRIASDEPVNLIFTSQHAVNAISSFAKQFHSGSVIYSISGATRKAIQQVFPEIKIAEVAADAVSLAKKIVDSGVREAVFFCGSRRLDNLPELLRAAGIRLDEVEVYQTIADPKTVEGGFDAIMFFSPSAVESFFQCNKISENTVCIAIGETTAAEIKGNTNNLLIISKEASQEGMIKAVKELEDKLKLNDVKE